MKAIDEQVAKVWEELVVVGLACFVIRPTLFKFRTHYFLLEKKKKKAIAELANEET